MKVAPFVSVPGWLKPELSPAVVHAPSLNVQWPTTPGAAGALLEEPVGALLDDALLGVLEATLEDEAVHCGLPVRPASAQSSGQVSARL